MEYVTLVNGVKMPKLGYGVFQIAKEDCARCVRDAVKAGYRHIDTAQSYFNEAEVGEGLATCGVPRDEIFLTTKVWISNYGYERTLESIKKSLRRLRTDYLDLLLLHQPFSDYHGAWHALEKLYREGVVRAIGISNFAPDRLADMVAFNEIAPMVNQVEVNPLDQQVYAQKVMTDRSVQIEAWAPFGEGRSGMFENPVLKEIADRYDKSVAQVILRWLMQRDVVALAKSTHVERMEQNFAIFDFTLSDEDMATIATLDTKKSLFFDHCTPEAADMFAQMIEARKHLV